MVGDLEDIHRRRTLVAEAGCQQLWIDLLLDIAHQEHPPARDAQVEDHRHVVDRRAVIGRVTGYLSASWPEDIECGVVQSQPIPGREVGRRHVEAS